MQADYENHAQIGLNEFTDDRNFRGLVNEMLDVKIMAKSQIRLYREGINQVMGPSLICATVHHVFSHGNSHIKA